MKGRVIHLGRFGGREAALLSVDGRPEDLLVDPGPDRGPLQGAIYRAVAGRPMKGQGGVVVSTPDGPGFLRQSRGIAPGKPLLVQVTGPAEGAKAAPVTTRLLFRSRYAIVTPGAPGLNLSRRIRDEAERDRLEEIAQAGMDGAEEGLGLILRSAAEGVEAEAIAEDIAAMRTLAERVLADVDGPPELLVAAPTPHETAWIDWSTPDPDAVETDENAIEVAGLDADIEALLSPRVSLPGGAWAMIEPTAALVAVDVNTGGDTSPAAGLKANLALIRDLPRQLRLRGLGGQIVLDLAPMARKDRRQLEDALRRALRADGIETAIAGWTPLGHLELQRKRDRYPLKELLGR